VTLPPLTPLQSKEREYGGALADCARAPQQPRQNLDRVPAPAGKTRRHDRRPPRRPNCFRPDETHTRLAKKDRKLPHRASRLMPEHGIHWAKGLLATPPRFPVKPRSQPLRHL